MDLDDVLAGGFALVLPHLTERQRRLLLGAFARVLGHGGVTRVAELAGSSRPTVRREAAELDGRPDPTGPIRAPGAGPKPLAEADPGLVAALDALVDPATRGDPQSPLRWTTKSTRQLADALTAQGHQVNHTTVAGLLRVRAELDAGAYPIGVKVSDAELAAVPLQRHQWHGDWNYSIHPGMPPEQPGPVTGRLPRGPLVICDEES